MNDKLSKTNLVTHKLLNPFMGKINSTFIFKKEDEHPNTKGTIYQSTKGYA